MMRKDAKHVETRVKLFGALVIIFAIIGFSFLLFSLEKPKAPKVGEATFFPSLAILPNFFNITEVFDLKIHGEMDEINEGFGSSVATGDLNNDGVTDLIVGADFETMRDVFPARGRGGKLYALYGPVKTDYIFPIINGTVNQTNGINITDIPPNITFYGSAGNDRAGSSVAVGDVNNDGYDDIVVGGFEATFGTPYSRGGVWVMYGPFLNGSNQIIDLKNADRVYKGMRLGDGLGTGVTIADFNNDGVNDLALGAFHADFNITNSDNVGKVYIEFGPLPNDNGTVHFVNDTADITIFGHRNSISVGDGLGSGDMNNDGVDDLIVGAPDASPFCQSKIGAGEVYFIYGPLKHGQLQPIAVPITGTLVIAWPGPLVINISKVINITIEGVCNEVQGAHTGDDVDGKDMNRDGMDDLLVSAPRGGQYGRVFIAYGPFVNGSGIILNLSTIYHYGYHGTQHAGFGEGFGIGLGAGDVDDDGINNLVIGAPAGVWLKFNPYQPKINVGFAYMVNEVGDIRGPVIELKKPENNSVITENLTVEFIFNVSDHPAGILNCSLFTNETGVFEERETINGSDIIEGDNMTIFKNMSNGDYLWNIQCYDDSINKNQNFAKQNYTFTLQVDEERPVIELKKPEDNSILFNDSIEFVFNVTDGLSGILNCSLYTNETGAFEIVEVIDGINITEGENVTITRNLSVGDYLWNVECYDDSVKQNYAFAQANYTFTIKEEDKTGPVIELKNPPHNSTLKDSLAVEFIFNVTDDLSGITDCTLFTNETGVFDERETINGSDIIEGDNMTIFKNMSNGDYLWNIQCYDDSINKNQNFAKQNFTFTLQADNDYPVVELKTPGDNSLLLDANVKFIFNTTDRLSGILNCSLFTNETGNFDEVETVKGSEITEGKDITIFRSMNDGDYLWNVRCYDDSVKQNYAFAQANYTFTISEDKDGPVIELKKPEDGAVVPQNDVEFIFNTTDDLFGILNCSLYTNETGAFEIVEVIDGINITEGENVTTTRNLAEGTYLWNVQCYDDSINKNQNFAPQNYTFKVSLPPPPTPSGGGGGGGAGVRRRAYEKEPPEPIPKPVLPEPAIALTPPKLQRPEFKYPPLQLPEGFQNTDITCLFVDQPTSLKTLSAERITVDEKLVPEGFEKVISPFKIGCAGETLDLTLNLPDNFQNLKVLRCRNGRCIEIEKQGSKEALVCGGEEIRALREKQLQTITEYVLPSEIRQFSEEQKTIEAIDNVISSGDYKVEFHKRVIRDMNIALHPPRIALLQPDNPTLSIIGTPVIIKVDVESREALPARITIPFPLLKNYDLESLSIYYYTSAGWQYLGGKINTEARTVTVEVENLFDYVNKNKEATFAVVGIRCDACVSSELKKVYSPESRDAIILVHGFVSSPKTWQPFIDEIALNKQPWQVWTFAYPLTKTIAQTSTEFGEFMELHSGEYDNIYIIGHSLGAFIAQEALQKSKVKEHSYVDNVKKMILVGSPNDGTPGIEVYRNLFESLMNERSQYSLFNVNSNILKELSEGKQIHMLEGIDYYVLAGTKPYEFNLGMFKVTTAELLEFILPNDGITTTIGAQHVGNTYINNSCEDYYEIDLTHTELIDHPTSRRITQRIISEEKAEEKPEEAIIGYNQYLRLKIEDCSVEDEYIIVGTRIREEQTLVPLNCACGNGYCDGGENELNCPADCVVVTSVETVCFVAPIFIYILLVITLLISSINIGLRKAQNEKPHKILRIIMYILLAITLIFIAYQYLSCRIPLLLAYLVLAFIMGLDALDLLIGKKSYGPRRMITPEEREMERTHQELEEANKRIKQKLKDLK